jgi:chemotaxis protein methyltransferase CheR
MAMASNVGYSEPSEVTWSEFYGVVLAASGLDLYSYKADQLRRRILSSVEAFGYADLDALGKAIKQSERELARLLDRLAINVTELYRNPESWEHLRLFVIPELLKTRNTLHCWSAGCSNGGEAYTLASLLDLTGRVGHSILGTDIDSEALKAAEAGIYGAESITSVPPKTLDAYFEKLDDANYKVSPKLKQFVQFKKHNLLGDSMAQKFDLIVCRNVVIYFTEEAKDALFQRFYEVLSPGGYLFVGGSERIIDPKAYGYLNPWPYIYRKSL